MPASAMEKTLRTLRVCKICQRKFANGKAMGGHMRSHFAKLPIPPKPSVQPSTSSSTPPPPPNNLVPPPPLPSALSYEVKPVEPPQRSVSELSSEDTESGKNPTRRRSKRIRKTLNMVRWTGNSMRPVVFEDAQILSTEEAAMCLLSMSRDRWEVSSYTSPEQQPYEFGLDVEEMSVEDDNEEKDDDFCVTTTHVRAHPRYKCEACNKVFRSHQALGGHRASHKNKEVLRAFSGVGVGEVTAREENIGGGGGYQEETTIVHPRAFNCPFCDKVFQSGQALGGHKKIHFSYLPVVDKAAAALETSTSTKPVARLFDLNLPATEDDQS